MIDSHDRAAPRRGGLANSKLFAKQLLEANEADELEKEPAPEDLSIDRRISASIRELRSKYPVEGLKSSRFLTSDILLAAPADYFDKFEDDLKELVIAIQSDLADRRTSNIVADAQAHPTDDAYQEAAYRAVYSSAADKAENLRWRGDDRTVLITLAINEIIGFSRIDPLWRDSRIDEIICNGPKDIQVGIDGRILRVPSCKFRDADHLMNMIERLYQAVGRTVSQTRPLSKARLHDMSRMHTVHRVVAPNGPTLNIRRHPKDFWTPKKMVDLGAASEEVMTTIGNLVHKGASYLVVGGTYTGKTSMLNALTGFYPEGLRILTLEDSIEMKPNPKKYLAPPMECIPANPDSPNPNGITMRDLTRAATQMRPDVIIVGEVVDGAAYDLCNALNMGHAGASSLHANSVDEAVVKLATMIGQGEVVRAESAIPMIAAAFDFIVFLDRWQEDGSKRVSRVVEVPKSATFGPDGNPYLQMNTLWEFMEDGLVEGRVTGHYERRGELSADIRQRHSLDLKPDLSWEELVDLSRVD